MMDGLKFSKDASEYIQCTVSSPLAQTKTSFHKALSSYHNIILSAAYPPPSRHVGVLSPVG